MQPNDPTTRTQSCIRCHRDLPVDQFAFRNVIAGKRHSVCRDCTRTYNAAYYRGHAEQVATRTGQRVQTQRALLRRVLASFLEGRVCQGCGQQPASTVRLPAGVSKGKSVAVIIRNGWREDRFRDALFAAEAAQGLRCRGCA